MWISEKKGREKNAGMRYPSWAPRACVRRTCVRVAYAVHAARGFISTSSAVCNANNLRETFNLNACALPLFEDDRRIMPSREIINPLAHREGR